MYTRIQYTRSHAYEFTCIPSRVCIYRHHRISSEFLRAKIGPQNTFIRYTLRTRNRFACDSLLSLPREKTPIFRTVPEMKNVLVYHHTRRTNAHTTLFDNCVGSAAVVMVLIRKSFRVQTLERSFKTNTGEPLNSGHSFSHDALSIYHSSMYTNGDQIGVECICFQKTVGHEELCRGAPQERFHCRYGFFNSCSSLYAHSRGLRSTKA